MVFEFNNFHGISGTSKLSESYSNFSNIKKKNDLIFINSQFSYENVGEDYYLKFNNNSFENIDHCTILES